MKNFNRCLIASLLLVSVHTAMADDWGGIERYAKANSELALPAKGEHRVVFLGNSITEGWYRDHPDFFNSNNYIGRGISGHTSYQFLVRFREDVINLKPEIVIINAGTNDCAENTRPFDLEMTFGNIKSMVELAQVNGIKVILSSVLPAEKFGWNKNVTDAADRIATLNAKIKKYAKEKKIPYVDYYSSMVVGPERKLNPAYTNDGVHPTPDGYVVMESIVKPVIDKTIKKK